MKSSTNKNVINIIHIPKMWNNATHSNWTLHFLFSRLFDRFINKNYFYRNDYTNTAYNTWSELSQYIARCFNKNRIMLKGKFPVSTLTAFLFDSDRYQPADEEKGVLQECNLEFRVQRNLIYGRIQIIYQS